MSSMKLDMRSMENSMKSEFETKFSNLEENLAQNKATIDESISNITLSIQAEVLSVKEDAEDFFLTNQSSLPTTSDSELQTADEVNEEPPASDLFLFLDPMLHSISSDVAVNHNRISDAVEPKRRSQRLSRGSQHDDDDPVEPEERKPPDIDLLCSLSDQRTLHQALQHPAVELQINASAACNSQRTKFAAEQLVSSEAICKMQHAQRQAEIDRLWAAILCKSKAKLNQSFPGLSKPIRPPPPPPSTLKPTVTEENALLNVSMPPTCRSRLSNPLVLEQPTVLSSSPTSSFQPQESFTKHSPSDVPSVKTYLEVVASNTPTSREANLVSSSSVASQSGAQTSVRTEQKQSAKPASNLPIFVEPKSPIDVVLKRLRILQRMAAQPIAQLYAKCLAENEVKFAQYKQRQAEQEVLYQAARTAILNKSTFSTAPTDPLRTQESFTKHSPSDAPTVKVNSEYVSSTLSITTNRSITEPLVVMSTPDLTYSALAPCSEVNSVQATCDESKVATVQAPTINCAATLVNNVSDVALDSYFVFDPGGQHNIWDPGGLTRLSH